MERIKQLHPQYVAQAEKFFWEFREGRYNHHFDEIRFPETILGDQFAGFSHDSRMFGEGRQLEGDEYVVRFSEEKTGSHVQIGMRKRVVDGNTFWRPNSISAEIVVDRNFILDFPDDVFRLSPTKVRINMNDVAEEEKGREAATA